MTALVYQGHAIRQDGEMLSLTDMWKAAHSPAEKRPADWLALPSTAQFREAVEASFNAGKSGIIGERGRGKGTLAHWQIALAYAKYLSHEFHMWCNEVVRAHMAGEHRRPVGRPRLDPPPPRRLVDEPLRSKTGYLRFIASTLGRQAVAESLEALGLPPVRLPPTRAEVAAERVVVGDPVATALRALAQARGTWTGTATQLLAELDATAEPGTRRHFDWPRSAQAIGCAVVRATPALEKAGVIVRRRHSGTTRITVAMVEP